MTDDAEARAVIQDYLLTRFPTADILDDGGTGRSARTWSVTERGTVMLLTASLEFLDGCPSIEILGRLQDWHIAEVLRQAGGAKRVVLTTTGVRAEDRS